jgi:hypothetical protein
LCNGATPEFTDPKDKNVFQFVRELAGYRSVADNTYAAALEILGEEQLTELVHTVAYYLALAAMLNAFAVDPPQDRSKA